MKINEFAREKLDDLTYFHTKAVVKLALELAEKEGADKEIVETAAWLHDIGRSVAGLIHHKESVEISEEFLKDKDEEFRKKVLACINEHVGPRPFSKRLVERLKEAGLTQEDAPKPASIESKCVYDADMINLMGPFGVMKCVHLWTKENIPFKKIVETRKKLAKTILDDLKTETGKELGKKEFEFIQEFMNKIEVE